MCINIKSQGRQRFVQKYCLNRLIHYMPIYIISPTHYGLNFQSFRFTRLYFIFKYSNVLMFYHIFSLSFGVNRPYTQRKI